MMYDEVSRLFAQCLNGNWHTQMSVLRIVKQRHNESVPQQPPATFEEGQMLSNAGVGSIDIPGENIWCRRQVR